MTKNPNQGSANHDTIMPTGKWKGLPLKEVPAQYLLWGYAKYRIPPFIRPYIQNHYLEILNRAHNEEKEKE